jgi:hypothetical protein
LFALSRVLTISGELFMKESIKARFPLLLIVVAFATMVALPLAITAATAHAAPAAASSFAPYGNLDCNGDSAIQKPLRAVDICTDLRGFNGQRGEDNGYYVGHDEPAMEFVSSAPGSGNNVQWKFTLPKERALPATKTFENQIAFWFSMALCDPGSYPQNPCTRDSDSNHSGINDPTDAGSAFLEMQFYPPGFSPFITQISCDRQHWCASLHINSAECTFQFAFCNPNCTEPTNFAFIQMNGVPTGPAGPDNATNATFTPNDETLLMNQGDTIKATIKDTPGGLLTRIDDLTTGKSGFMVASAANGFQSLNYKNCAGRNFSFHPEFATAKFGNFVPWAALQANVGFAVEIGHFQPGANGDGDSDDAPCFPGPTLAGCIGADLDFDGTSYKADWPDGTRNNATSLQISSIFGNGMGPVSAERGSSDYEDTYPAFQFETDLPASEKTCKPSGAGCVVPPPGASFYPFYAQSSNCTFTFGNDIRGATVNDFGRGSEYGTPNLPWFFGTVSGGIRPNPCTPRG